MEQNTNNIKVLDLVQRWRDEERSLSEEIFYLRNHKFEFEVKVKEKIRDILLRRRLELERILGM